MIKRIMLLVAVIAMTAAAGPAFAFHYEGHIGGDTPDDKECNDSLTACHGGYGGIFPFSCDLETGECTTISEGGGSHSTFDPATGDSTFSGGSGGNRIAFDENGQEIRDPGGGGMHCEFNYYTGEGDCHGSPGTSS